MELPPLQICAMAIIDTLTKRGIDAKVVLPALDDRFFVYMFGRGVPPPKNRFRWCTPQLKIEPMESALKSLRDQVGQKFLMLTGVRVGESAARDQRISISCSKDGAECGQGWFQEATPAAVADTLAPCLHWRVCNVWDWLTERAPAAGFPTAYLIADAYGGHNEMESLAELNGRTGCVGCNLASKDQALDRVLRLPQWSHLEPLKRLRPLYVELQLHKNRIRKDGTERKTDGSLVKNPGRWGELERRGEDMGDLRVGLGRILPLIAQGRLAAEAVVAFAGRPVILRYLEGMNLELQRRLADGETIPVYLVGEKAPQALPLIRIPPKAIPHIIRDGIVCTPAEQRLAMSPKKRPPVKAQPRYSAVVNKEERTIKIGNTITPIATVTAALAEAAGCRAGTIVDTPDAPAKARAGKFTEDEVERLQAAAKSQGIPEWEFIRRCVMACLV